MRLGTVLVACGLLAGDLGAQQPAGARAGTGHPTAAAPAHPAASPQPVHPNGRQGVGVVPHPAQQGLYPPPSATGNYYTGGVPQPGYNVGGQLGVPQGQSSGANIYNYGPGRGRGRGTGLIGVPAIGGAFYPGFVDVNPTLNSFPSYSETVVPQPPMDPYGNAPQDPQTEALVQAQNAMADQIRQLSEQLAGFRNAQAPAPAPQASPNPQPEAPQAPPLHVILRTGQSYTVKSFAVMNGELWDFSGPRVRKIPVSNIDVAASTKATEAGGGQFPSLNGSRE